MQVSLAIALIVASQTSTSSYAVDVHDARIAAIDPHARRVLTGRQLAERGITNLAEALEHIPAAYVRTAGRGGVQVDLRGARKGGVLVLIDGVPVSDPFFGNFDVASIPSTDIAEIRVSKAPASPVDGPGGHGGVVEVITRAAVGKRRAFARVQAGTAPGGRAALTAKGDLVDGVAARVSGGGAVDARSFTIAGDDARTIDQSGTSGHGGALIEWVGEHARLGADLWAGRQSYVVPPSQAEGADLVVIDGELAWRATVLGELELDGDLTLSARGFAHRLTRDSIRYPAGRVSPEGQLAQVEAGSYGAYVRAEWLLGEDLRLDGSATFVFEDGRERDQSGAGAGGSTSALQAGASVRWSPLAWMAMEAAGGAALPLLEGVSPWPEARAELELTSWLATLTITGARKGRAPTLRERYQPGTGNPEVGPEQSWYGEAEVIVRPLPFATITGAGWVRANEGLIKFPAGGTRLDNTGDLLTAGADAQLDVALFDRAVDAGVVWMFQAQEGDSPLDFFPAHRAEAWIQARFPEDLGGVWVRGKHLGSRIDQAMELGAVTTLDVGVHARFDRVRLTGRVENLFDAAYLAHAFVPAFGRTVWLGLELETP